MEAALCPAGTGAWNSEEHLCPGTSDRWCREEELALHNLICWRRFTVLNSWLEHTSTKHGSVSLLTVVRFSGSRSERALPWCAFGHGTGPSPLVSTGEDSEIVPRHLKTETRHKHLTNQFMLAHYKYRHIHLSHCRNHLKKINVTINGFWHLPLFIDLSHWYRFRTKKLHLNEKRNKFYYYNL